MDKTGATRFRPRQSVTLGKQSLTRTQRPSAFVLYQFPTSRTNASANSRSTTKALSHGMQ
jgi:hypothetical protein